MHAQAQTKGLKKWFIISGDGVRTYKTHLPGLNHFSS